MQTRRFTEALTLLCTLALSTFLVFDEEPMFDFTDLNVAHVGLFFCSVVAILSELTCRSRYGHYVYKDTTSLLAALAFWMHLDNYVRGLFLIFAFHALTPLEIDLIELVEVYHVSATWLACEVLPAFFCVGGAHACVLALSLTLSGGRRHLQLAVLLVLVSFLIGALLLLTWDVVVAGLSLAAETGDAAAFYAAPKTALTYDGTRGVRDQFDWHRERTSAFVMRFEDLYFFVFRLLFLYSLTLATGVWLFVCADFARPAGRPLSYTQVAVGALWLEHAWLAGVLPVVLVGVTGLRLLGRAVAETTLCWG